MLEGNKILTKPSNYISAVYNQHINVLTNICAVYMLKKIKILLLKYNALIKSMIFLGKST